MSDATERSGAMGRILDAAILAGGESRRMGRDKATIELDGESLLARAARSLSRVFPRVHLSTHGAELTSERRRIIDRLARDGIDVSVICDRRAERLGPLAGIEAVLQTVLEERFGPLVAFSPVDTPAFDPQLFDILAGCYDRDPDLRGVFLAWHGQLEPLHGVLSVELLPEIRARLDRGELSVRALARLPRTDVVDIGARELGCAPSVIFANLNERFDEPGP